VAGERKGVAPTIEALVMFSDRVGPGPEPCCQRRREPSAFEWMLTHGFPFVVGERAGLVQDVSVDGQRADVVQKGGPPQSVATVVGETKFFGHQVGEGAHWLCVPPGPSVVGAQRGG